jgi:hypothetical protein
VPRPRGGVPSTLLTAIALCNEEPLLGWGFHFAAATALERRSQGPEPLFANRRNAGNTVALDVPERLPQAEVELHRPPVTVRGARTAVSARRELPR